MPLLFMRQDIKTSCSHNGYSWLGGGREVLTIKRHLIAAGILVSKILKDG